MRTNDERNLNTIADRLYGTDKPYGATVSQEAQVVNSLQWYREQKAKVKATAEYKARKAVRDARRAERNTEFRESMRELRRQAKIAARRTSANN